MKGLVIRRQQTARTDPWNVVECPSCDPAFNHDDEEVTAEDE